MPLALHPISRDIDDIQEPLTIVHAAIQPRKDHCEGPSTVLTADTEPRKGILFPVEVWTVIFKHLRDFGQQHATSIPLVSSALRHAAEMVLYRNPELYGSTSGLQFVTAVSHCTHRAAAIRELSLLVSVERDDEDSFRIVTFLNTLSELLDHLPNLISLGIFRFTCPYTLVRHTVSFLLRGKTVSSLRCLRGEHIQLDAEFLEILAAHPLLEEVHIGSEVFTFEYESEADLGYGVSFSEGRPDPKIISTFEDVPLPKLRIFACTASIARQMKTPRPTLTHLSIDDKLPQYEDSVTPHIILFLGAHLVSLRIICNDTLYPNACYTFGLFDGADWAKCTRLRYLHIDDYWGADMIRFDYWLIGDQTRPYWPEKRRLPPALETLVWVPCRVHQLPPVPDSQSACSRSLEVLNQVAVRTLKEFPALKKIMFSLNYDQESYHWSLSPIGESVMRTVTPQDLDEYTWANV